MHEQCRQCWPNTTSGPEHVPRPFNLHNNNNDNDLWVRNPQVSTSGSCVPVKTGTGRPWPEDCWSILLLEHLVKRCPLLFLYRLRPPLESAANCTSHRLWWLECCMHSRSHQVVLGVGNSKKNSRSESSTYSGCILLFFFSPSFL